MQISLLDENYLISSKFLPKISSDHHPISLLVEEEEDFGKISFRFNPLWIEREGFWETMSEVWSQYVDGSPSYVWEQKLKRTKYALKAWIKKPLSTPYSSRKETVKVLANIQFSMEESEITKPLLIREKFAQANYFLSFRQEEEFLHLKSRSLWLQAGDKNLAYFHRRCRLRLSRNHISKKNSSEGVAIKGQLELKQAANSHFLQLFTVDGVTDNAAKSEFLSNIPSLVLAETNVGLVKTFSKQDVV